MNVMVCDGLDSGCTANSRIVTHGSVHAVEHETRVRMSEALHSAEGESFIWALSELQGN